MTADFEWPVPPHFELVQKSKPGASDMEPCLVALSDGRRQNGKLVRLDPAASILEFHPEHARTNVSISFSGFQSVRLTGMVELRPVGLPPGTAEVEVYPSSVKQKCVVNFKDGDCLISETVGFVPYDFGLFLFIVSYGRNVVRWFIPTQAMTSYQIGDQLGKLLVNEKIVSSAVISAGLERQEQLRSQKIGEYLQQQEIVSQQQVEAALKRQKAMPLLRLGDALIQEGAITQKQLDDALAAQTRERKKQLGEILVDMSAVNKETIRRVLAQKLGIPFVGLSKFQFDLNLIKSISGDLVRKHSIMPLYRTDSRIVVAMENPLAADALKELAFVTKLRVDPVMASEDELHTAIRQFYGSEEDKGNIAELVSELDANQPAAAQAVPEPVSESDNTLVRLVNKIIMDAYETGVSDIHIESMKGNKPTRVRFRKDGVMSHYSDIPANFRNALISRIKIMSRMDISERRHAQDGKINFEHFGPARVELRVVTIPTTEGLEDVVLRILAAPRAMSLDAIDLAPQVLAGLKKLSMRPHGLLLVCGPTGSGKTTALHALLGHINTPDRKIWTVEDPVEITQDGLRQIQVNAKIDWTFANVLRSILRADPDVIMVGETRDFETAKTVLESSLTGHLVVSTMHTNSAVESVVRMLDLGLDPFNFADALLGVVGQRLARRLCPACRKPHPASDEALELLAHEYCFETDLNPVEVLVQWSAQYAGADGKIMLYAAQGCQRCNSSGYKGRIGVHELLTNTADVRKLIHSKATVADIQKLAMAQGMRTLKQDGIHKILQGHTDWEQIKMI